jgi:hypothetical protein
MTQTKKEREARKVECINNLKARRETQDGVNRKFHAEVMHVSASGMSRHIAVYLPYSRTDTLADGTQSETVGVSNVSWLVAYALGWKLNKAETAVVVGGCGMDMRFHLLDTLAHTLGAEAVASWISGQTRGTFGGY